MKTKGRIKGENEWSKQLGNKEEEWRERNMEEKGKKEQGGGRG